MEGPASRQPRALGAKAEASYLQSPVQLPGVCRLTWVVAGDGALPSRPRRTETLGLALHKRTEMGVFRHHDCEVRR
jgi:hypothetical protein